MSDIFCEKIIFGKFREISQFCKKLSIEHIFKVKIYDYLFGQNQAVPC